MKIGRYEIQGKLGSGSMGVVYQAWDPRINRIVALKVLDLHEEDADLREKKLKRFYREAETAGGLTHPNIVTIFDFRDEDGTPYIVMEFVEGQTLKSLLANSPDLPLQEKLDFLHQICGALQYAHSKGVIHRDIKPGNIMVTPDGRVMVTDFSLAKISRLADSNITRTGQVMGTLYYMSPEHFSQKAISPRSDIFSLGVVMYEMFTGLIPFEAEGIGMIIHRILHEAHTPAAVAMPGFSEQLSGIIDKTLAKDPAERFASAADLDQAIREAEGRVPAPVAVNDQVPPPARSEPVAAGSEIPSLSDGAPDKGNSEIIRGGTRMYDVQTYDEGASRWTQKPPPAAEGEAALSGEGLRARRNARPSRAMGHGSSPVTINVSFRRRALSRGARRLAAVPLRVWAVALIVCAMAAGGVLWLRQARSERQGVALLLERASLALTYGFTDVAERELGQLPARAKVLPEYGSMVARVRAVRGDWPGVLATTGTTAAAPLAPPARLARARALAQLDRQDEARDLLQAGLARHPDNGVIQLELGRMLRETGNAGQAVHHLRLAAESLPADPDPPWELARIYLADGKDDVAEEQLRIALDRNPAATEPAVELAALLERTARQAEAAQLLEQVLFWEADRPEIRASYVRLLVQQDRAAAAARQIQLIEILDPVYAGLPALKSSLSAAMSARKPKGRR